ncbi:Mog1/PsbP alpha/beta/alpha sandwich [Penicillium bovifimosum]|uniref:Mog1/PsbP alpha/beta/alpha sandwich n=1 Tax=Penicillium bovifimosum TaxID=126998 RepID=A0A9W9H503_9EURO|nr:Mog1/PsbP alpha/beta/alpha sandwich [Penicillium bovifimosum]KAJ5138536.1 Mog1/PsbP alpha/beta/alpha sandwich [Penicillium bovifimosum]
MPQVTEQAFFGGAIRGIVPQGWIDSSTLREVPDHQELWLSPTTLSSLIIEINQRVSQDEALKTYAALNNNQAPTAPAPEIIDQAAALYHLHDLCDEGDTMQVIKPPQRVDVRLAASTPSPVTAYCGIVSFTAPVRGAEARIPASAEGAAAGLEGGLPRVSRTSCHYLLVRLEAQETDLLVFFNVPHEEFDKSGNAMGLSAEEVVAEETVGEMVGRLEVCDWGLFV